MLWFFIILFTLISFTFFSGRGGFLIAGDRTVGKDGKPRYDEKKLCRVNGGCMAAIALLMLVFQLGRDSFPILRHLLAPGICLAAVVMVVLANAVCKNPDCPPVQKSAADLKWEKFRIFGTVLVISVIAGGTLLLLFTGRVTVSRTEAGFHIDATYWRNMTIADADISAVSYSYTGQLDLGSRVVGFGGFKMEMGKFNNEAFGDYTLYAYTGCKSYVVLETTAGTVVLNAADAESTRRLYEDILSQHMRLLVP